MTIVRKRRSQAAQEVKETPETQEKPHISRAPTGPDRYAFHHTVWRKQTESRLAERMELEAKKRIGGVVGNDMHPQPKE